MTAAAAAALARRVRNDAALTRPGDPHRESVAASPALGDEIRQQPGMVCGIRLHSNRRGDLAFYIQTPSRRVRTSGRHATVRIEGRGRRRLAREAGASADAPHAPAADGQGSAGGDACFLAKEQSWRTAWRTRSMLSRTSRSRRLATGARSRRTVPERGTLDSERGAAPFASNEQRATRVRRPPGASRPASSCGAQVSTTARSAKRLFEPRVLA
jgi:hypothetical protein